MQDAPEPEEAAEGEIYDEGFEDDADFYAPPLEAPDEPEASEEGEEPDEPEKKSRKKKSLGSVSRRGRGRAPGPWGKLVGLLAAASIRRANDLSQPDPEPEDVTLRNAAAARGEALCRADAESAPALLCGGGSLCAARVDHSFV